MALRKIAFENAKYKVFVAKEINEGYKPNEQLCVDGSYYTFGDVFSYALESGRCPLEALERAKGFGHNVYWLSQNPIVLSARGVEEKEYAFSVNVGDQVKYAGKIFTVKKSANNNLVLIDWGLEA